MLEHPSLIIEPPRPARGGSVRSIRDATTAQSLGCAMRTAHGGPALRWLLPRSDLIYEHPDLSLVATVQRLWWLGPAAVVDAEGMLVGSVRGRDVFTPVDQLLAYRIGRRAGSFRSSEREELAGWSASPAGVVLT